MEIWFIITPIIFVLLFISPLIWLFFKNKKARRIQKKIDEVYSNSLFLMKDIVKDTKYKIVSMALGPEDVKGEALIELDYKLFAGKYDGDDQDDKAYKMFYIFNVLVMLDRDYKQIGIVNKDDKDWLIPNGNALPERLNPNNLAGDVKNVFLHIDNKAKLDEFIKAYDEKYITPYLKKDKGSK